MRFLRPPATALRTVQGIHVSRRPAMFVLVVWSVLLMLVAPSVVLAASQASTTLATDASQSATELRAVGHQLLYRIREGSNNYNLALRQPFASSRSLRLTSLSFPEQAGHGIFSPDGRYVLYARVNTSSTSNHLYIVGATGQPQYHFFSIEGGGIQRLSWGADSRTVAYRRNHSGYGHDLIATVNIDTRTPLTIATNATFGPIWDLTGTRLYYSAVNADGETDNIRAVNTDGTNNRLVVEVPGKTFIYGVVADGRILFRLYDAPIGSDELYLVRPDGTNLTRFTSIPGYEYHVTVSPNGEFVLFGRNHLTYLMNMDGDVVWAHNCGAPCGLGTQAISWSPDSAAVAFTVFRQETSTYDLYMGNTDGAQAPMLFLEETAYGHGFSSDGRYFAYDEDPVPGRRRVQVLDTVTGTTHTVAISNNDVYFSDWRPIP